MVENKRPSWDHYFMHMAKLVSSRSTCLRRQVGAVIVKSKRVLTTGYNGAPSGLEHCLEIGCLRDELKIPSGERHELCRAIHAEQNALVQAASFGVSVQGATIYSTTYPCNLCAKMLINSGIKEIVVMHEYPDKMASEMLDKANIAVRVCNVEFSEISSEIKYPFPIKEE
ncbi:MAG: cytidine deaminase [candidate division Zixibacteria bacterium]|nr:cytidine deaminase [candidate division Zixibacteria bacterium]